MTLEDLLTLVTQGGVVGILILILVGGHRRWWVWGWLHRETTADRDYWRDLAIRGTELAEHAITRKKDVS